MRFRASLDRRRAVPPQPLFPLAFLMLPLFWPRAAASWLMVAARCSSMPSNWQRGGLAQGLELDGLKDEEQEA